MQMDDLTARMNTLSLKRNKRHDGVDDGRPKKFRRQRGEVYIPDEVFKEMMKDYFPSRKQRMKGYMPQKQQPNMMYRMGPVGGAMKGPFIGPPTSEAAFIRMLLWRDRKPFDDYDADQIGRKIDRQVEIENPYTSFDTGLLYGSKTSKYGVNTALQKRRSSRRKSRRKRSRRRRKRLSTPRRHALLYKNPHKKK